MSKSTRDPRVARLLDARKGTGHKRVVADLQAGLRQRSARIPSGKVYRRKARTGRAES